MKTKKNPNSRVRVLAVMMIIFSVMLFAYASYLLFSGSEDKAALQDQNAEEQTDVEVTGSQGKKLKEKLFGKCFSNDEDGVKTVIMFSEKEPGESEQRITTIVYRDKDAPVTEEQRYDISDDGKKIIYDPGSSSMERDIKVSKDELVINKVRYKTDDINKYTN